MPRLNAGGCFDNLLKFSHVNHCFQLFGVHWNLLGQGRINEEQDYMSREDETKPKRKTYFSHETISAFEIS